MTTALEVSDIQATVLRSKIWLAAGANPEKALRFARMNVGLRKTPRAYGLLAQAIAANEVTE